MPPALAFGKRLNDTMHHEPITPLAPRWLHWLAVATALFTLPLLFLGAGVTSHGVGMVDPRGFRPPWEIVSGLIENSGFDFRLEYGHRTFGFLVGICAILLAIGCWFFDRRSWMGWLSLLALVLICVQGALGIFRVDYNALHGRTFATIHGVFAQIVFAVLASLALFTSRRWTEQESSTDAPDGAFADLSQHQPAPDGARFARPERGLQVWSIITVLVVFAQVVLGGLVRHQESVIGPRGHLFGAFLATGAILWLFKLIRDSVARDEFHWPRIGLKIFLTVQVLLGIESWLAKFYVPQADLPQLAPAPLHGEWLRTLHYVVGALLFSTTVLTALIAHRASVFATAPAPAQGKLEGAL
jgi:heme A synthase